MELKDKTIPNFLVDVRCFTFNQSKYITDTMNGFCMQLTNFPFICCIVDDASTDGEQEVIDEYLKENFDFSDDSEAYEKETDYAFITYARHKTNRNCYFYVIYLKENHFSKKLDKNKYLSKFRSNCKYEALCEGDDYWIAYNKLQLQVDFLEANPDYGLIRTDANVLNQKSGIVEKAVFENHLFPNCSDSFVDYVVCPNWLATCTWMMRMPYDDYRELPEDCFNGDLALMIYVARRSKVKYLNNCTSVYRVLENSASHFNSHAKLLTFWRSQVNTRCFYAKYLSYSEKMYLLKNIVQSGRCLYITKRRFNVIGFLALFLDLIFRIFLVK